MHRAAIYSAFKQPQHAAVLVEAQNFLQSRFIFWKRGAVRSVWARVDCTWLWKKLLFHKPIPPPPLHLQVRPPSKLGARFCEGKLWNSDNMTIWPLAACESQSCNCITPMSDHCWKFLQFWCKVILSFFHSFHSYPWPDLSKKRSILFRFFLCVTVTSWARQLVSAKTQILN